VSDSVVEFDVDIDGGRTVHGYDTGPTGSPDELAVVWHHGTPNIGAPPVPLFAAAQQLNVRWLGFDRPGYGASSARPGRQVADAAVGAAAVADARGIERFAVMGHSGGGPHALACAALLPERVVAVATVACLAPFDADGLDWFAGMGPGGVATLQSAAAGRAARERYEVEAGDQPPDFVDSDFVALRGEWGWFGSVVGPALAAGPAPMIADDLAYVQPWGFDLRSISAPVLLVHGADDLIAPSAHSTWLAGHLARAELWLRPDEGHIAALLAAADALGWLRATAG
jgi:pimeloyl-ACP methyl ester carboxylesterase